MIFKPMNDRVLVKPVVIEGDRVTAGGIIIAPTAKTSTEDGTVVAVGSEVKDVKVGDVVGFLPFTGTKIKLDNVDHIVMREEEIWFVVVE